MKNLSKFLASFFFLSVIFISTASSQLYQKTHHNSPKSFDRYAQCESLTNPFNVVLIGKVDDHTVGVSGFSTPQVMELDANGNLLICNLVVSGTNEELVYNHIESAYNGYVAIGYTKHNGFLAPVVTNFDHLLNIISSVVIPTYENNVAGVPVQIDGVGMHITKNIASGYIMSGFTGIINSVTPVDRKAFALELDFGLGVVWARSFDSPSNAGSEDFDMFTHGLTVNSDLFQGYFFSGSSNGSSSQEAAAVMLDTAGNIIWKTHYANNIGGGHRSVAGDALFDSSTNLIHQLVNNTSTHCWGISAFEAFTGVRDAANSWGGSIANTSPNIEALSLEPSLVTTNLCVAGYQRDHNWVGADGNTYSGSVPFLVEVKKLGSIVWDKRYLIPNTRFLSGTPPNDLLSTFSGQQTIIRHESMLTRGTSDYTLHSYRDMTSASSGLEIMKVSPNGTNVCESEPLGFDIIVETWFHEDTQVPAGLLFDPVNFIATTIANDFMTISCADPVINPCELPALADVAFTTYDASMDVMCFVGCAVGFNAPGLDPDLYCAIWDFGDGTITGPMPLADQVHCYNASGVYLACLSIICCDDPTVFVEYCIDLVVDCGDLCELQPSDLDPLDIIAFPPSVAGSCCYGVCPMLSPASTIDIMSLCIDLDWGDGSAPLLGQMFAQCYDHCYAADGTYTITVTVTCCNNPDFSVVLTEVVTCGCVPECYVRNSFWSTITGAGFAGDCVVQFDAAIFLGPNMIGHQNPSWTIDGVPVSNQYTFSTLLAAGIFNVCHTIEGTLNDGSTCEFTMCRDVHIECCVDSPGGGNCSDITGDGVVTIADLLQLLSAFGQEC